MDPFSPQGTQRPTASPKALRHPPIIPTGPRLFSRIQKAIHTGGPGEPPADFLSNTTSAPEWMIYWANMRVLDPDRDPRIPPFYGGRLWSYQKQALPRFEGAHGKALSTNIDFLYEVSYPAIAVRIQSYRYHLAVDAFKQAYDALQLARLSGQFMVVDLYEEDFIGDETGQAAIILVKEALSLIRRRNPLTTFETMLVRPGSLSP